MNFMPVFPPLSLHVFPGYPSGHRQNLIQCLRVLGHEPHFVLLRNGNQTGRIGVATNGVPVHVAVGFNPEAVERPHEDQIEFAVGQQ